MTGRALPPGWGRDARWGHAYWRAHGTDGKRASVSLHEPWVDEITVRIESRAPRRDKGWTTDIAYTIPVCWDGMVWVACLAADVLLSEADPWRRYQWTRHYIGPRTTDRLQPTKAALQTA